MASSAVVTAAARCARCGALRRCAVHTFVYIHHCADEIDNTIAGAKAVVHHALGHGADSAASIHVASAASPNRTRAGTWNSAQRMRRHESHEY